MDFDFLFITLLLIVTGFCIVKKDVLKRLFIKKSASKEQFAEADASVLPFVKKYEKLDTASLMHLLQHEQLSFSEIMAIEKIIKDRQ